MATTEVSEILVMLDFVEAANVYGVTVPGKERKRAARVGLRGQRPMFLSQVTRDVLGWRRSSSQTGRTLMPLPHTIT